MISLTKKLCLLLVPVLLFSFSAPKMFSTDYSGTWSRNDGKSDLGQFGGRGVPSKLVIEQKGNDLNITRHATNFQGEPTSTTEKLTADGKEAETTVFNGAKRKSTLKWSGDATGFTVSSNTNFEANGQTIEIKGTEVWTMAADGKSLTVENSVSTPQGEFKTKAVFDKQ